MRRFLKSQDRRPKTEARPIPEVRSASLRPAPVRTSGFGPQASGWGSLLLGAWLLNASAAEPFLSLRETTLGYHGPSEDLTNLTEIRIGWFGPTNLNDPLTGDLWWAANLAIRDANAETAECGTWSAASDPQPPSLVTRHSSLPFRLVPRWAVDPWGTGVSQLARMVYDDQPIALIGSVDSASTHLAEQVVAKANLPLISPIATDPSVTLAGVSWVFSCAPSDAAVARALVDGILAIRAGGSASLALWAGTDHESRVTAREVVRELSRRGRAADFRFDLTPGAAVPAQVLDALGRAAPRAVLVIAGPQDAARWLASARTRCPGATFFGSQGCTRRRFLELAGAAAEGLRVPILFQPGAAPTEAARFLERFQAERQHAPDYAAVFTYDATRLLVEAIRRAGANRTRVREALLDLSPWPGLAGPIRFDGTGQNLQDQVAMGTIRGGVLVALEPPAASLETAQLTRSS